MIGKDSITRDFGAVFCFLKKLHDGLSIKMCTLANESVKEPLETGIIMQLWNGSPAGTAPKFRLRNRQLIALSADTFS